MMHVSLAALLACGGGGGATQPPASAQQASAAQERNSPSASGEAVEHDLYEGFDAEKAFVESGGQPSGGGLGACHSAAADWEQRARPAIKACYREGKKSNPYLMGSARLLVEIDVAGKAKPPRLEGTSELGDAVIACMIKAVQNTSFSPPDDCRGRPLTIPVQFPTRR